MKFSLQLFWDALAQRVKAVGPLKFAFILFFTLILFIIIVEKPGSFEKKHERGAKFFMPKLLKEDVARIEIFYADPKRLPVVLLNENHFWVNESDQRFPVDPTKMESLIEAFYLLKEETMVSRNPEKHELYGVNAEVAHRVQVWNFDGKVVGDFLLGKKIGLNSQYLRRSNERDVYQVNYDLTPLLDYSPEAWRSKRPLRFDPALVERIQVSTADGEWLAEERDGIWMLLTPREEVLSSEAVLDYLTKWTLLDAQALVEPTPSVERGLNNPDHKITLRLNDDTLKLGVFLYDPKSASYLGKNGEREFHYQFDTEALESIFSVDPLSLGVTY